MDTYNDFKDNQGNQLQIGELNYASKKGKSVLSFADNVPARDIKSALSLVVRLLLEHSSVSDDKSSINDSLMVQIKKSSTDELTHSNSFGRVNSSFAKFVVDFLAMSLLFDSFLYHNAQAAPAPSEVVTKMILMGHPVSSCHVPVVSSYFIFFQTLISS